MVSSIFESVGRISLSRGQMRNLAGRLSAAGLHTPPEAFTGFFSLVIILVAVILSVLLLGQPSFSGAFSFLPPLVVPLIAFVLALVLSYIFSHLLLSSFLLLKSDARRTALELALPDFLLLVSSNIKAGMPLDQGMWYAAKPEFGLLSQEVKAVVKRSFGGESLEAAMDMLSLRFDSKLFTRTITLIKQASATGGEISAVLESTASDVRNTNLMKKEVAASLVLYEIFVLFAGMLGTPFLFAVAGKLVKVFEFRSFAVPSASTGASIFGAPAGLSAAAAPVITSQDFFYFSIATIFVTALFSSFIVGVIRKGTKNEGIKYFPLVVGLAYTVYFLTDSLLSNFFSTFSR